MKQAKRALGMLIAVLVLCSLLAGCAGTRTEIKDLDKSLNKATEEWLKNYVSTEMKGFSVVKDQTEIREIKSTTENVYEASGTLAVTEKATGEMKAADYTLVIENIDYVGMVTATFKLKEFRIGEFSALENTPDSTD